MGGGGKLQNGGLILINPPSKLKTAKWHQLVSSIGVIYNSTYHKKWLNPWSTLLASSVLIHSLLFSCPWKMKPFTGHLSTRGCLANLRYVLATVKAA